MLWYAAAFFAGGLLCPSLFGLIDVVIWATGEWRFRTSAYRQYWQAKPRAERYWRVYWWWHVVRFWFVMLRKGLAEIRSDLVMLQFTNGMTFRRGRFGRAVLDS